MSAPLTFELLGEDASSPARRGRMTLTHGIVETPVFMPVGTLGTVKGVLPEQLVALGAEIVLGNTYHLMLRPGVDVVEAHGGLNTMMGWQRPILTDSGGFQVFSLRDRSRIDEEGVTFRSHIDGAEHLLTPERAIRIQEGLGSDIMMTFDDCPPAGSKPHRLRAAVERTERWARRCIEARAREQSALFGIMQGGLDEGLRRRSIEGLLELPFEGYAIGGLSVGESRHAMWEAVRSSALLLPAERPRYLMGVGTPEDLLVAVGHGVDMFDCVLPTRNARNARVFTAEGALNLRNSKHRLDTLPIVEGCTCSTCTRFSRAYIRHLLKSGEILGSTLASIHNLHFLVALMGEARTHIEQGTYAPWAHEVLAQRGLPAGEGPRFG